MSLAEQEYSIRQATLKDIDTIVAQRRGMLQEIRLDHPAPLESTVAAFKPWLIDKMNSGKYLGWLSVAPDRSAVAGIGLWLIEWPPNLLSTTAIRGYILNVYTDPAHRKRGLARRLTQTVLDWCRSNDIEVVILHASQYGRPLYESLGFTSTNEMRLVLSK